MTSEQARADVRERRRGWIEQRRPRMRASPGRLVFIDETAVTTKMTRLRGRGPCGQRLVAHAPFGRWETQTFIAGLRCSALTAPWVLDGPMNQTTFEVYVETQLAPTLSPGDVVVLDNVGFHKSARAAEVLKARGAWFLFLPPTPLTSTRARWPSQSSRLICARPAPVPSTPSGRSRSSISC